MDTHRLPSATVFRFGDRRIVTTLGLRELPLCLGQGTDREIQVLVDEPGAKPTPAPQWLHEWGEGDAISLSMARFDERYLLRFSGLCDFTLDFAGQAIHVQARSGVDDNTLEHLLVDQVLPRFLAHEGELLVHACALSIDGRTALFLGESGWGKSTLAALLHRAGHALLSDDCVQMQRRGPHYHGLPTYPSLRLFADSMDHAFPGDVAMTAVAGYSDKRRLPVASPAAVAPIAALYLLDEPSNDFRDVVIDGMRPVSGCLELMRHAFKLELTDRQRTRTLFAACSEVARVVPAFSLDYPRDFGQSASLVHAITRHLASLPEPGSDREFVHARR